MNRDHGQHILLTYIGLFLPSMDILSLNRRRQSMILTNDTLSLFPAHWLANDDRHLDCIANVRPWLIAHHFTTVLVDTPCIFIYSILWSSYLTAYFLFPSVRRFESAHRLKIRWPSHGNDRGFLYVFSLLLKDILFVLVYVSGACLWEWLRSGANGDRIASMTLQLWIMEATIIPGLFYSFLGGCLFDCLDLVFEEYQLLPVALILCKIPVFFWMRYAENHSDLGQNRLEVRQLIRICEMFFS